jgi:hypothetical protein
MVSSVYKAVDMSNCFCYYNSINSTQEHVMDFVKVKLINTVADINDIIASDAEHWLAEAKDSYSIDDLRGMAVILYGDDLEPVILDSAEVFFGHQVVDVQYASVAQYVGGRLCSNIRAPAFVLSGDPTVAWIPGTDDMMAYGF